MQDIQQIDPVVFTSCARCQDDIYEGYDYILTDSYDYCVWKCLNKQMLKDETAIEKHALSDTYCGQCQDVIYKNDKCIYTDVDHFCSWYCTNERMRVDRVAVEVVAGEY